MLELFRSDALRIRLEGEAQPDDPWVARWVEVLKGMEGEWVHVIHAFGVYGLEGGKEELLKKLDVRPGAFEKLADPSESAGVYKLRIGSESDELAVTVGAGSLQLDRRDSAVTMGVPMSEAVTNLLKGATGAKRRFAIGFFGISVNSSCENSEHERVASYLAAVPDMGGVAWEWQLRADFSGTEPTHVANGAVLVGATILVLRIPDPAPALRALTLDGVGPGDMLALDPIAPRLNIITGDNGLGKSFFLETAWWALTRTWHTYAAVPNRPSARIHYRLGVDTKLVDTSSAWDPQSQGWAESGLRPPTPCLVVYARVDGSFSVWDPARNYRQYRRRDGREMESPRAYQFTASQVMEGLEREVDGQVQKLCLGLIDDWRDWQRAGDVRMDVLKEVLAALGAEDVALEAGELKRPYLDDVRMIPTVKMGYHQDVPLIYAPAGVKRMCMMAYILTWAMSEHREASKQAAQVPSRSVVLMVDEPECHLHPRWQRTVVPSLMKAVGAATDTKEVELQLLLVTHSPLVLASLEPIFDTEKDALWKLDLGDGSVKIEKDAWRRRGTVGKWLTSDVFDLKKDTSKEAEDVMVEAGTLIRAEAPARDAVVEVDRRLLKVMSEQDPFFLRWRHYMERFMDDEEAP